MVRHVWYAFIFKYLLCSAPRSLVIVTVSSLFIGNIYRKYRKVRRLLDDSKTIGQEQLSPGHQTKYST